MQIHYAPIPNAVQCRYVLFSAGGLFDELDWPERRPGPRDQAGRLLFRDSSSRSVGRLCCRGSRACGVFELRRQSKSNSGIDVSNCDVRCAATDSQDSEGRVNVDLGREFREGFESADRQAR